MTDTNQDLQDIQEDTPEKEVKPINAVSYFSDLPDNELRLAIVQNITELNSHAAVYAETKATIEEHYSEELQTQIAELEAIGNIFGHNSE